MAFCPRCGVQLDRDVRVCPLDGTPIPALEGDTTETLAPWPAVDPLAKHYLTGAEIRERALLVLSALLLLPIFVVTAIDFYASGGFEGGSLSWSLRVSWILLCSFLYVVVGFNLYHAFLYVSLGYLGITAALLLGLDFFDTASDWFLTLGLPILLSLAVILVLDYLFILKTRNKGFNVFGAILAGIAAFLIALDVLIGLYLRGALLLSWSLLTTLILLPLAFYLFFLHYGLRRRLDLGRTFHF